MGAVDKSGTHAVEVLTDLVARAKRKGATAAEAMLVDGVSMSVTQRLGKRENLNRAEGRDLGLRVFLGQRQAMASTSDTTPASLEALLDRTLSMARAAPEEPYCGLADPALLVRHIPRLELLDDREPTMYRQRGKDSL